jgi:hypothetical protein
MRDGEQRQGTMRHCQKLNAHAPSLGLARSLAGVAAAQQNDKFEPISSVAP